MRYLKVLLLAVFFFAALLFLYQNKPVLDNAINLKLAMFGYKWTSPNLPIYLLVLIAFLVGAVLSTLYFFVDKMRCAGSLRACKSRVSSLEQEVNSLRNMPLDEPNNYTHKSEEPREESSGA